MFLARHHPNFAPCPHSTLTTSLYHGLGRCGLNGRSSSRLDGQLWRVGEGGSQLVVGGKARIRVPPHAAEPPTNGPGSPDLPTGRVGTSGLSTAQSRLPEPTERGSGYLGLDLAQVCKKNECFQNHHHFVHTGCIFCKFAHNVHIEPNSLLLCTLRAHCAHCAHLVHTVHTVHTWCTPCAHCALRMFSVASQEQGRVSQIPSYPSYARSLL
jgi:hypothetical protein